MRIPAGPLAIPPFCASRRGLLLLIIIIFFFFFFFFFGGDVGVFFAFFVVVACRAVAEAPHRRYRAGLPCESDVPWMMLPQRCGRFLASAVLVIDALAFFVQYKKRERGKATFVGMYNAFFPKENPMPPRINRPNLALRQFAAQADAAQGLNNRVIFRNGRLQTASGVSAFFAGSEARRATVEAFKRSIIREYGQTVGDALSPRLDTLCAQGKSLKASVIQDFLRDAAAAKEQLGQINRTSVHAFCNGDLPGHGVNEALDAFYAAHPRLTPALRDDMRELVLAQLQTFGVLDDQNLNDPFKLFDDVSQGKLPCMIDMMAACGELPESAFYPYRDLMERGVDRPRDVAWLANFAGSLFTLSLMAEKLPEMRALQPEGLLTLETAWRVCFGEDVPQAVLDKWPGAVGEDFFNRTERLVADALERMGRLDPGTEMSVKLAVSNGIRLERAIELCARPGRLTLEDLTGHPRLYSVKAGTTPEEVERAIAADLNRWGTQGSLVGYEPVIAFRRPTGDHIHRIRHLRGLSEAECAAFRSGQPSPKSRALMDSVRALCGEGHPVQEAVVGFGLSQAGLNLIRNLSSLTGVPRDEHSPCDITVRPGVAGDVFLHYETPPNSPLDFRAEYVVHPDGSSELTALDMGPRDVTADE